VFWLLREANGSSDVLVQGIVAIVSGIIVFAALFLPWLGTNAALWGLRDARNQAQLAIPMTLILLSVLVIFGGLIHIGGYKVGIQIATVLSALAFFISVMVIVATLATAENSAGTTLNLLVGPWIAAAGAVFGAISSKLERD
jgi:hypothetical protein